MKKLSLFAMAALAFAAAPHALRGGPVTGSLALLALGVGLALAASGSFAALAAAGGALGAFAFGVLSPVSPAAGGAVLVGLAFAERTSRVRGAKERLLHIAAGLLAGALAGTLAHAYTSASTSVRIVAAVVAAVLVALPLFVEADDPVAHRLDAFADDVAEPARTALREGADLRRAADPTLLDRADARQVKRTWAALLRLAEARSRLERNVLAKHRAVLDAVSSHPDERPEASATPKSPMMDRGMGDPSRLARDGGRGACPFPKDGPAARAAAVVKRVDERIAEHVSVLARAHAAVDTAHAAEASLDDAALRSVESVGESLETMTKAIVEEV